MSFLHTCCDSVHGPRAKHYVVWHESAGAWHEHDRTLAERSKPNQISYDVVVCVCVCFAHVCDEPLFRRIHRLSGGSSHSRAPSSGRSRDQ
jgi:hypothetical protein